MSTKTNGIFAVLNPKIIMCFTLKAINMKYCKEVFLDLNHDHMEVNWRAGGQERIQTDKASQGF